jgi:alpha-ribazole phosphatase/probable phosphoglycerate mutase
VKHLILVRHAETDMAGRFCGHSDPEVNSRGRQQLAGIVDRLSEYPIQRIYTSDLRRAIQTAEAIAAHFGLGFEIRSGLREIHFGTWEGLSWNEIQERDPVAANCWAEQYPNLTAPGGEPFQQFRQRVSAEASFLNTVATEFPIAVVTHAGFIRVLLTSFYGVTEQEAWRLTKDYGSVVALDTNLVCNVMRQVPSLSNEQTMSLRKRN